VTVGDSGDAEVAADARDDATVDASPTSDSGPLDAGPLDARPPDATTSCMVVSDAGGSIAPTGWCQTYGPVGYCTDCPATPNTYVCEYGWPPVAGCIENYVGRNGSAGYCCVELACLRSPTGDGLCADSGSMPLLYSCPVDDDGGAFITPDASCTRLPGSQIGFCCDR
jgi:hypothetical protein